MIAADLDHFKEVNDTRGHETGDAVLRETAYEMRKCLRSFELFYRLGGEEFLVVIPGAPQDDPALVTPTLKVRRDEVLARIAPALAALYGGKAAAG